MSSAGLIARGGQLQQSLIEREEFCGWTVSDFCGSSSECLIPPGFFPQSNVVSTDQTANGRMFPSCSRGRCMWFGMYFHYHVVSQSGRCCVGEMISSIGMWVQPHLICLCRDLDPGTSVKTDHFYPDSGVNHGCTTCLIVNNRHEFYMIS